MFNARPQLRKILHAPSLKKSMCGFMNEGLRIPGNHIRSICIRIRFFEINPASLDIVVVFSTRTFKSAIDDPPDMAPDASVPTGIAVFQQLQGLQNYGAELNAGPAEIRDNDSIESRHDTGTLE
jgi:hypothetical protein